MRLRRSRPYGPGIRRIARGRGFSYVADSGEPVADTATLERIRGLVIPPAWRKVWICPYPNGHIQAVGVDAAGRRQYLYHERWRRERDEEKFDRVLDLARRLPEVRKQLEADLGLRGLPARRVQALAISLVDRGVFRVGGEEYAEENGTRGVATLLRDQVRVSGAEMVFDYVAKGGIRRRVRVRGADLARAVRALRRQRTGTQRLLVYRDDTGFHELHAEEINTRFKELTTPECSVKDLRTWQGTVLAAAGFGAAPRPQSQRGRRKVQREIFEQVADALGNTPTVARDSYIDPRVVEAYDNGATIQAALRRANRVDADEERTAIIERAVIRLLRKTSG
ncbi:DNA topoisomerase IB [Nocardia cyriacigeorgica]|uniref:DNA topoisomerase n=1 Tax=Nocardia cyriacigeorgica TaxID=135487 RepID=A0A4U8VX29_9NOCA|nr:DNA topoisomerase IB [Nocardia cyriacigeorgica]VFA97962.1 Eukaryotic DNA topoisomerase I, catalytic core [Nocardia cyriacigeorgica]